MKKTISAILAVMMLAGVMTGCKDTPDDNGKDTETTYESSQETEKGEKKTVAKYTKEVYTDSDGKQTVTEYEHDSKGNVIKKITNGIDTEYEYDDKGFLVKEIENHSDGNKVITEYEYDNKGDLIKKNEYDGEITVYEYDDKGNVIKEWIETIPDDFINEYVYDYDEQGAVCRKHTTGGKWCITWQYEYDEKGNKIKDVVPHPSDRQSVTTYEYDDKGNVVKEVSYPDGAQNVWEYEYDGKGNVVKKVYTYPDGNQRITKYKYEYNGNNIITIIQEDTTVSDGYHIIVEWKYEYDEKGRKTKEVEVGYMTIEYEYNDKENKVKESITYGGDEKDELHEVIEWTLDEQGRKIKGKVLYTKDAEVDVNDGSTTNKDFDDYYFENEYDEKGNLIREVYPYCDPAYLMAVIYEYNEHGDVVKKMCNTFDVGDGYVIDNVTEYNKDGKEIKRVVTYSSGKQDITEWKYEYDDNGNLIKKIELENGEVKGTYEYSGYVYFDIA